MESAQEKWNNTPVENRVTCFTCGKQIDEDEMYLLTTTPHRGVVNPMNAYHTICYIIQRERGQVR